MRKRKGLKLATPSTPAAPPALTSSRGRVVKPRLSPDGTPLHLASNYRLAQPSNTDAHPPLDAENARCGIALASAKRQSCLVSLPPLLGYLVALGCRAVAQASLRNNRGCVAVRDDCGRFAGVRPQTAAERLQVPDSMPV